MAVRLREALATLPGYVGGRTVPDAVKLASNETPYPALPYVVARLTDTLRAANRYPDPASSKLTAALAERYELPVTRVVE
jgi:histidinol-phosphate aminotransferase